jgi:hypothetical protein
MNFGFANPFRTNPEMLFLEAISFGHTDKAAAGVAGWTDDEAKTYAAANPRDYEIASNKRQHAYEQQLIATGRGADIARVALKNETRSWVQRAEPAPQQSIEDFIN